jgi:hypothetical protein
MTTENERTSREKFSIEIGDTPWGKRWATVRFHATGQTWVPSLADLHRIISSLAFCEELKYPSNTGRAEGGGQIFRFLQVSARAWQEWLTFADLARDFKIPERRKTGAILNGNGARLDSIVVAQQSEEILPLVRMDPCSACPWGVERDDCQRCAPCWLHERRLP